MWRWLTEAGRDSGRLGAFVRSATSGIAAFACAACLWIAGCSGNYGAPPTVPVKGRITIKGAPLEGGAEVAFVPKDQGGDRRPGIGRVNPDGTYVLTSHSVFGDGVEPGDYKVIVYPVAEESQDTEKKDAGPVESPIPEKYRKPESTTLETSVDEEDKGADFDFDLE